MQGRRSLLMYNHRFKRYLRKLGGLRNFPNRQRLDAEDLSLKALEALQTQLLELQMVESVFCEIRKEKMKGLEKEEEMTHIETDPDAARRKITSLFDHSEEMLRQGKKNRPGFGAPLPSQKKKKI
ncbi:hypothetical protein C5167_014213 [Papaver somniferum]|uniref:Uncharacterized protein n=1 Tax=Papaver somniferum TaxID=3469 RepID=A0A4Y7J5L7_PAPSO|nr:hypothetical protein C5167_014213 [Papaver somniferum]